MPEACGEKGDRETGTEGHGFGLLGLMDGGGEGTGSRPESGKWQTMFLHRSPLWGENAHFRDEETDSFHVLSEVVKSSRKAGKS